MGCFISHPAPAPAPAQDPQQETPGTFSSDPDISRSWVYFKIIERGADEIFYAYNLHVQKSLRFPSLPEWLLNSATAVLNGKVYVIGGTDAGGNDSKNVYMCDPMAAFTWSQLPCTITGRESAVAVAANGMIYVFGGCLYRSVVWAEVYDPSSSTPQWTALPYPPLEFSCTLSRRPLQLVVCRHRIFVRNDCSGIAFNVAFSIWESRLPRVISNYWFKWPSPAAEVSGMFVAYHQGGDDTAALHAYDRGRGLWLPLELNPVDPAEMGHLLSVNGSLVEYHVGELPCQITFRVMQMKINPTDDRMAVHVTKTLTYLPESAEWDFTG
ncbi:hypothetical protein KI387_029093 [Taxus chinensis]|uniref:Uncharacterized protein n=1 Tax=Taxus chinensis TaxID=29808 RepID=A0AA38C974_TAXCH|nr:hypothetical protein KI387_029093 [Taxus chinensis]